MKGKLVCLLSNIILQVGKGDCDSDDECVGALICGKKSCAMLYPTSQAIDPESDCCIPGTSFIVQVVF